MSRHQFCSSYLVNANKFSTIFCNLNNENINYGSSFSPKWNSSLFSFFSTDFERIHKVSVVCIAIVKHQPLAKYIPLQKCACLVEV